MEKIALYDFDKTIIGKDSNPALLAYYLKRHPWEFYKLFKILLYVVPFALKLQPVNKAKSAWLFPLDKMTESEISAFYQEALAPFYNKEVVATIYQHKQAGYKIYLCSASVEAYLKVTDLPFDKVIGTKVKEVNNRPTSQVVGKNCKGKTKVERINQVLQAEGIEIDYLNSYAYSDSKSDIPMLKMVQNRIKVSPRDGSMSEFLIQE